MLVDTAFEYPADFQKAWKHRLANRIFKGITKETANNDRCQCCDKRVGQSEVSTSCWYNPIKQLVFLGPGVPLLFVFIQNGMMTLGLLTLIFSIYAVITNIIGKSCDQDVQCVNDIFNMLSLSNKIQDNLSVMVQSYLIVAFLALYLFISQYFIYRIRQNNVICDEIINSPSDYSIIIRNLPQNVTSQEIENMINDFRGLLNYKQKEITNNLAIKKIIISYSLHEYLKEKNNHQEEFLKIKKKDKDASYNRPKLQRPTKTASIAIVIFHKQVSKEMFFEEYTLQKSFKSMFVRCSQDAGSFSIRDHPVPIMRAPEPDDILWQNADIPKCHLFRNIFLSYFFGIAILLSGGVVQYILQYSQQKIKDTEIYDYFSYATSIIVTLYNTIIVQFLIITTKLQGHQTKTSLDESLMVKICLYSFFNTGIFYSLASILAQQINNFDIQGGFSFQVTLFVIMNAVPPNLTNIVLSKLQFPAFIFRYLWKKGYLKYSQKELNELYELKKVDFPVQYAYVIKTIWITCFYAPFAPIVVPISIAGLALFYFTQGELFRTKYSAPNMISLNITKSAMRLLDFTGLILSIGQILIMVYIKDVFKSNFTPPEQAAVALCLAFSAIMILIPSSNINERLFQFENKFQNQIDYDEALSQFQTTYEVANPLSEQKERKRRSDINLFKFLKIVDQKQMSDLSQRTASKPLLDGLIKNAQNSYNGQQRVQ